MTTADRDARICCVRWLNGRLAEAPYDVRVYFTKGYPRKKSPAHIGHADTARCRASVVFVRLQPINQQGDFRLCPVYHLIDNSCTPSSPIGRISTGWIWYQGKMGKQVSPVPSAGGSQIRGWLGGFWNASNLGYNGVFVHQKRNGGPQVAILSPEGENHQPATRHFILR